MTTLYLYNLYSLFKTQTPLRTGPVPTGFVLGRMYCYYAAIRLEKTEIKLRSR